MAGLLNPESGAALARLGAGLLSGNFAGGLASASEYAAGLPEQKLRAGLLQAQLSETQAQSEYRRAQLAQLQAAQEMKSRFLNGGGVGVPGAPASAPDAQGPSIPSGQGAGYIQPQGGLIGMARQMGIPEQAIQADVVFNDGKGIAEMLYKRGVPDMQVSNGYAFDKNRLGPGFLPQMSVSNDGKATMVRVGPDGLPVVQAPRGALETFAGYQGIQEGTKAAYDPMQVVGPGGANYFVPRSQVVQGAQGGGQPQGGPAPRPSAVGGADADRFAILSQELAKARASGNAGDVAALEAEISRLSPSARTGTNPSGLSVPGFQATPTAAQAAEAAGAKVGAEAAARAEAERLAGRQGKTDKANDMLSMIGQARSLLEKDPTASGVGAVVDSALGLVGKSTKGADVAAQLEAISGWMVNNVPRMEGPQSNFDVQNYRTMAGIVGDRTKPISTRMAALQTVETLQRKYAHLNGGEAPQSEGGASGSWGGGNVLNELPKSAPKGQKVRDTATGKVLQFNGLSWVEVK